MHLKVFSGTRLCVFGKHGLELQLGVPGASRTPHGFKASRAPHLFRASAELEDPRIRGKAYGRPKRSMESLIPYFSITFIVFWMVLNKF